MSHLCKKLFSTILETEGLLSKIIMDNFNESHDLYIDLLNNNMIDKFKNFIYSKYEKIINKPKYNLVECTTESDIEKFRKYYAVGEELCTFGDKDRLKRCRVFFAVKKNVDEIKRENFKEPKREDEYGTSVISIQFTKDGTNTLSIKNRYNHRVNNPDATYKNNLDNIIED